jgi:hypothetical protein
MFSLVALLRLDYIFTGLVDCLVCCFVLDLMYVLYHRIGTARTWFSVLLNILLVTMLDFGQEIWY